jgi:tetratricopeptide (TPR) repeat protein
MKAREEYIQRVPPSSDVMAEVEGKQVEQATVYEFDVANYYFSYGDFAEARKRFTPMYEKQCGVTPYGYKAWERLNSMAAFENNVEETRRLAAATETKSCALTEEQKALEKSNATTMMAKGYYIDAYKAYQDAEKMPDGPDRPAAWRKAAALYKVALEKAPERNEAPEAAILGANAFKQVGEYDSAIAMYELFIKEYGSEERLAKLETGDPKGSPPVAKDPVEYEKRITNLKLAYTELSKAYVLFFNYKSGAGTNDTISRIKRFPEADRRTAATNAVILYANIGDDEKLLAARQTLYSLNPSVKQKMEIDYLVATADLKRWDENAPVKAIGAMEAYYQKNRNTKEAAPYLVRAAYASSKMHRIGKDGKAKDWCSNTMKAFDAFKSGADAETKVLGSEEADMAAECAYLQIDEQLRDKWDYDTNHHRYTGVIDKVKIAFDKDLKEANDTWFPKLQTVIETYSSPKWSVAARARQGSLYDSVRTGLYNATPPAVKLYTPKEEDLLKKAETSDNEQLQEQADAIRQNRREQWRSARERSLEEADKAMVRFYAESTLWARSFKVRNEAVDSAIRRLAFFTDILGNAKMRDYSQGVLDPDTKQPFAYEDNLFLRTRPGLSTDPPADGLPAPLPARP